MSKSNLLLIMLVSVVILVARFLPHAPNFSPVAAVLLFAGVYAKNKKYLILPLIALFISDIFIGFYDWKIMLAVYGSLALIGSIGFLIKKHKHILNIATASLASALVFFLVTNFAVWYFGTWYSHDLNGLILCYNLAIPFFRNTLISTVLYSGLLFGSYESLKYLAKEKILLNSK